MKFRKRPIVIDAELYKPGMEDGIDYDIAMFGTFSKEECIASGFTPNFETDGMPYINTLEGKLYITKGDWIITGIKGERYPCKPDIFELTYELVEE